MPKENFPSSISGKIWTGVPRGGEFALPHYPYSARELAAGATVAVCDFVGKFSTNIGHFAAEAAS